MGATTARQKDVERSFYRNGGAFSTDRRCGLYADQTSKIPQI
jgi:hypothetical protein